ncbi:class I SAM-dependent methyltransferase [soil metagenome]
MTDLLGRVRDYWDADAATYDRSHGIATAAERAAWNAVLKRLLPSEPARVLDVGAGTGFLSLLLAELGHEVTALDLSAGMLARLQTTAAQRGLDIAVVNGPAHEPPGDSFDVVTERHLLWVLPDPRATLATWRRAAPDGRLVVLEGLWGGADAAQAHRQRAREALRRFRGVPPAHHADHDPTLRDCLPFGHGTRPEAVVEAVEEAGWRHPELERLRDVEWARLLQLPFAERLLGVIPQYAVVAT